MIRGASPLADSAAENRLVARRRKCRESRTQLADFMDYDLGYFDHETCRLEPLDNPFGPKVLPEEKGGMSFPLRLCPLWVIHVVLGGSG